MSSTTDSAGQSPVPELPQPEVLPHGLLHRRKAYPFVTEGSVYGYALREYLAEPTILRKESAISALAVLPESVALGITVGARAHLFHFHPGYGVTDVAVLSEIPATGAALLQIQDTVALGGWWGPGGGGLFRHDATNEIAQGLEQFRGAKGAVEPIALPDGVTGVAALTLSADRATAYAVCQPDGSLIAIDLGALQCTLVGRVAGAANTVVTLPDGALLGAGPEGRLWRFDPVTGELRALDVFAPCQQGKRYANAVNCLLQSSSGMVYGGTSADGYLFSYCPDTGEVANLGKPLRLSDIRALAEGHDGRLFGVADEPGAIAHFFAYDPESHVFTDLGVLSAIFPSFWIAHSLGSMAVGPNGEVFVGETGDMSHLFIYYPPVVRR